MTVQRKPARALPATGVQTAKKRGIVNFFVQTWSEFNKVVWPSRQETFRLTAIVIAITAILGVILGAIDFGFTRLIGFFGSAGS